MIVFPNDFEIPLEHTETNFSKLKASLKELEEKIANSEQDVKKYQNEFLKNQFYVRLAKAIYHLRNYQIFVEKESKALIALANLIAETISNSKNHPQDPDKEEEELLNIPSEERLMRVRAKAAKVAGLDAEKEMLCQQYNLFSKNKARALGQLFNCYKLIEALDKGFSSKCDKNNLEFNEKLLATLQENQLIEPETSFKNAEGKPFTFLELIEYFQLKKRLADSPDLLATFNTDLSLPSLTTAKVNFDTNLQLKDKQAIPVADAAPKKSNLKKSFQQNHRREGYETGVEFEWGNFPWATKTLKKVPEIKLWQRRHTIIAEVQTFKADMLSSFAKIKSHFEELKAKLTSLPSMYQDVFKTKLNNLEHAINSEHDKYITIEKNAAKIEAFSSYLQQANEDQTAQQNCDTNSALGMAENATECAASSSLQEKAPEQPCYKGSEFIFEYLDEISAYEQALKECDTNYCLRRIEQISKEISESSQNSASLKSASNLQKSKKKKTGKKSTFLGLSLGLNSSRSQSSSSSNAIDTVALEEPKQRSLLQRFTTQLKIKPSSELGIKSTTKKSTKSEKKKGMRH